MSQHGGLGDTARRWRELHGGGGDGGWSGLLDPLDLDLRRTVLRYGEMAQATYDAFNRERASPHAGLSRFARARFFDRVRLLAHAAAYRVTRFLYTTSSVAVPEAFILKSVSRSRRCRESNWIGYVAVATDEGKAALGRARRRRRVARHHAEAGVGRRPRVPHGTDQRPPRGRPSLRRPSSRSAMASPERASSSSAAASRASMRAAREQPLRHGLAGAREQQLCRGLVGAREQPLRHGLAGAREQPVRTASWARARAAVPPWPRRRARAAAPPRRGHVCATAAGKPPPAGNSDGCGSLTRTASRPEEGDQGRRNS